MVQTNRTRLEIHPGRFYMAAAAIAALFALLVWRVLMLQIVDGEFLQNQGDARTVRMERISAHRGMIQDSQGRPLAVSSPVGSIWVNPREFKASDAAVQQLGEALDIEPSLLRKRLAAAAGREFSYLKRHLPPSDADRVIALDLPGIYRQREYHRYYPAGEVTAQVLGFTDIDDAGQEGVELAFNEWLEGQPGKKMVLKNLYGQVVRDIKPIEDAQAGRNLALTLDLRVQYLAYRELKSAVIRHHAESGSAVVLDVATGEVVAMANQPSFNPNDRATLTASSARNRAVTDLFEPGSTVKPFTVATAFMTAGYHPDTTIDTSPGFYRVGDKVVRDPMNYGMLDVASIVAKSSQVGIARIALTLDAQEIWDTFHRIGFGQDTGLGFPGESSGYLPNHARWTDIDRATFAYGYGLSVTPLQLAEAYLVLASGGIRKQVSIIKATSTEARRVLPQEVARQVLEILEGVVTQGTGSQAAIEGYSVAGKTGTVRKVGTDGYQRAHHLAFFAGIAPASNPRLVAVIMINDPQSEKYGGGAIAAPVFARIMSGALRLLNVAPDRLGKAA